MSGFTLESIQVVNALPPVADAFDSTVYSDILTLKGHERALFLIQKGVGTTGTSTITIEASDDFAGSNVAAVPFRYRRIATIDVAGAVTEATTAGFTTTAGSNDMYLIEVDAIEIGKTGYANVRLKAVEVANSPVLLGIVAMLIGGRWEPTDPATAVA